MKDNSGEVRGDQSVGKPWINKRALSSAPNLAARGRVICSAARGGEKGAGRAIRIERKTARTSDEKKPPPCGGSRRQAILVDIFPKRQSRRGGERRGGGGDLQKEEEPSMPTRKKKN